MSNFNNNFYLHRVACILCPVKAAVNKYNIQEPLKVVVYKVKGKNPSLWCNVWKITLSTVHKQVKIIVIVEISAWHSFPHRSGLREEAV